MDRLTLQGTKTRLTRTLISWQLGAIGLMALAVLVNMALMARIAALENARKEDAAQYQDQLAWAEHVRDMAVQELGALSLRQAEERQAREAQAEAYAALEGYRYIGECTITAYCCEAYEHICGTGDGLTATGLPVSPGMVAVDPKVIPLGSTVVINGQKYLAADAGVTGLCIDVAVPTHEEALELGVRTAEVWIATAG